MLLIYAIIAIMDARWLNMQFELQPEKSKSALARALGLEPPAVSKIISGVRQIKASEYLIMREFFGLPIDGGRATSSSQNSYVVGALHPSNSLNDGGQDSDLQWVIPAHIMAKHTHSSPDDLKNFRVEDNMMAPEFNKGEHVIVDIADIKPSPPGTFIVSDSFGFMLRYCEFIPNSNPPKMRFSTMKDSFQSEKSEHESFELIGRVIAKLQWL